MSKLKRLNWRHIFRAWACLHVIVAFATYGLLTGPIAVPVLLIGVFAVAPAVAFIEDMIDLFS